MRDWLNEGADPDEEPTPVCSIQPTDDGWILLDAWGVRVNDETYPTPDAAAEAAPWYGHEVDEEGFDYCDWCESDDSDDVPF
jgi:hypothetical protein